jgi:serine/tyrosine/threonine adenylyltransferase
MSSQSQGARYTPDPRISEIADFIGSPVQAASFPKTILRYRNDRAAAEIGLDHLDDAKWVEHFGRFAPLPDNMPEPLALRYHGHQFRHYNPDIGDGRGFLFAQMRDHRGQLLDLGTKGSGQTPYSRFGDGRLTLKGAVREILATEMLEALGVETSRTFSVIETGEALTRGDEPSPTRSAVLVRMSHGHIRIGSFQRLATLGDSILLKQLVRYCLRHYFDDQDEGDDAAERLLGHVVERTAHLAASYMTAGFVHGVLNSDNINITGESFDYGPWRWTPTFDPGFTAAYFDENSLYAFARQAEAIHWDVAQLAGALLPLSNEDALISILNRFAPLYREAIVERTLWRLGVSSLGIEQDIDLVTAIESALYESQHSIDDFYYDWVGGLWTNGRNADVYQQDVFAKLTTLIKPYANQNVKDDSFWQSDQPCSMHIDEVEAIWAAIAEKDDWSLLHQKVENIRLFGKSLSQINRIVK